MNPAPTFPSRFFRRVVRLLTASLIAISLGTANAQEEEGIPARSSEDLDKLVAPVALYPDALVALILPASTVPTDVTLAARFLAASNDPATIPAQPWDESVKALARYPEVVKWMDENLAWTRELGEAFAAQSSDVMNAVQRMRTRAQTVGTLKTTPQQEVVVRDEVIYIEPAQPEVIYVPHYNYDVVYGPPPWGYAGPFLSFGAGYPVGAWLSFDVDWRRRVLWRDRAWHRHDSHWRRGSPPLVHAGPHPNPRPWHPPKSHFRDRPRSDWRRGVVVARPSSFPEERRLEGNRTPHVSPRPGEHREGAARPLPEATPRVRGARQLWNGPRENSAAGPNRRLPAPPSTPITSAKRATPVAPTIGSREFRRPQLGARSEDGSSRRMDSPRAATSPATGAQSPVRVSPSPRMAPATNPPSMRNDSARSARTPPAERSGDRERRDSPDKRR